MVLEALLKASCLLKPVKRQRIGRERRLPLQLPRGAHTLTVPLNCGCQPLPPPLAGGPLRRLAIQPYIRKAGQVTDSPKFTPRLLLETHLELNDSVRRRR